MAKNKVQSPKSISIHAFISQLGTEEQCRKRLFDMRWPTGYLCGCCGCDKYCELKSRQLYQCNQCHHQGSVTSGTLFSASKLPLNICFLAIYLITQEKNYIFSLELSRQLGIPYNAAWYMKHKLMQAMKERDDETPLNGYIQLDDVYLGGVHRGTRGRGAKGKRPFVATVSMNEDGHPINMRFSVVTGFKTKELTCWAKANLVPKSLVISDGLACFKGVKKADVFHLAISDNFVLSSIGASILKKCSNSSFTQVSRLHRCLSGYLNWLRLGGNQVSIILYLITMSWRHDLISRRIALPGIASKIICSFSMIS